MTTPPAPPVFPEVPEGYSWKLTFDWKQIMDQWQSFLRLELQQHSGRYTHQIIAAENVVVDVGSLVAKMTEEQAVESLHALAVARAKKMLDNHLAPVKESALLTRLAFGLEERTPDSVTVKLVTPA